MQRTLLDIRNVTMGASELTQAAAKSELADTGVGSAIPPQQREQQAVPSQSAKTTLRNRADQSISPYVQSHATSPVAWQILDAEAVELAKKENKLIFLNVGFKACHCKAYPPSILSCLRSVLTRLLLCRRLPTHFPRILLKPRMRRTTQRSLHSRHRRPRGTPRS